MIPQHIQIHAHCMQEIYNKYPSYVRKADKILKRFRKSILNLEIKITFNSLNKMTRMLDNNISKLRHILPVLVLDNFMRMEEERKKNVGRRIRNSNNNKIVKMKTRCTHGFQDDEISDKSSMIANITEVDVPIQTQQLLALGTKFAINPPKTHRQTFVNMITDVEYALNKIYKEDEDLRNQKRQATHNILTNYANKQEKPDPTTTYYQDQFKQAKIWLSNHPEVVVTTADKGNKTVIMYREGYNEKMDNLLSDTNIYERISRDPTNQIITRHNKLINEVLRDGGIDESTAKTLMCRNGILGRIYGQIKLHKEDKCLRPIISTVGTTTYNLAKHLSSLFRHILGSTPYDAIDSFKMAEQLRSLNVPEDHVMISLDVVSLFTNIPKVLVCEIIEEKWEVLKTVTTLNKNQLISMINSIIDSCYFTYDDKIYRQVNGLPMGSALSPPLADLVLEKLLQEIVSKRDDIFFLKRYVDDLFLIIPATKTQEILEAFNGYHQNIKFTLELEKQQKINFLELSITRLLGGTLQIAWYRKPTASLRYVNFYSNHTWTQKMNTIGILKKRWQLFSDPETKEIHKNDIINILMKNDYPKYLIKRHLDRPEELGLSGVAVDEVVAAVSEHAGLSQTKTYLKIPYIRGLSQSVRRSLRTDDVDVVFYNTHTVGRLYSNLKDTIPISRRSNLVYELTCSCQAKYVGQSRQFLGERLRQHQYSLKRLKEGKLNHGQHTGITQHIADNPDHNISFDRVKILQSESNYYKRLFKEALHIYLTPMSINLQTDLSEHIVATVYSRLIRQLC